MFLLGCLVAIPTQDPQSPRTARHVRRDSRWVGRIFWTLDMARRGRPLVRLVGGNLKGADDMRWNMGITPKPATAGDLRIRKVFLFFPQQKTLGDGSKEYRWLEWAWLREVAYGRSGDWWLVGVFDEKEIAAEAVQNIGR